MKFTRALGMMLFVLLGVALVAACGDDEGDGGGGEATTRATESPDEDSPAAGGGEAVNLEIAAEDIAFDPTELTAPAGADVILAFDNDDPDIQHNWSLYETPESEEAIFEGERITGVESIDYEFTAPSDPGTYHFHCDVHPAQMEGEFIVE